VFPLSLGDAVIVDAKKGGGLYPSTLPDSQIFKVVECGLVECALDPGRRVALAFFPLDRVDALNKH
jgi:hypothetical protein